MGDGQTVNGQARTILAVSAVLSALAILVVALRFYTKTYKGIKFHKDDWLILAGLVRSFSPSLLELISLLTVYQVLTLGVTINNIVGVAVGGIGEQEIWTNQYSNDSIALFPTPKELLPDGKVMFVMQIMHTCAMPVIKASVLTFYWRIFVTPASSSHGFKIAIWVIATCKALFEVVFPCSKPRH